MSSSDLSDLSSSLSNGEDIAVPPASKGKLEHYFKQGANTISTSPPAKKKRPPSPPYEYVLADNENIPFICMFRSRFSEAFPKSLPHYGPQDIEGGVVESVPGDQIERLLCALLGLVLNRKKDIEKGHYTRALEEAIQTHNSQWPAAWQGKNPLHGGGSFVKMMPEERLTLLRTLIIWSLGSSEVVQAIMKESYKRSRQDDDLNQPLSVQSWGRDGEKRRYWLIEGQDDTHFRLYRESNPALRHVTWRSIAGTIEEVKEVAERLGEENSLLSRRLKERIQAAIPRFEASEDKRKRRDYRLARRAQFVRPETGFSLYEGRTRGKRMKYTYSEEEEEDGVSDGLSTRRSNRQSDISTPTEPSGPTFTASGRQVRSRHGGTYGETMLTGQANTSRQPSISGMDGAHGEDDEPPHLDRPRRTVQQNGSRPKAFTRGNIDDYNVLDSMDDESDASLSGDEWVGGDDDEPDIMNEDDEDDEDDEAEMSDNRASTSEEDVDAVSSSLVVSLRYKKNRLLPPHRRTPESTDIVKDSRNPLKSPISLKIPSEATIPTFQYTQPSLQPQQTPSVGRPPPVISLPRPTIPQYSQDPSIPTKQPTSNIAGNSAYGGSLKETEPSPSNILTNYQSTACDQEGIQAPKITFKSQSEANGQQE